VAFIVPEDEQSILRMLGLREVPPDVALEYQYRITWFHGFGHSGPLGIEGLVNLLRFLDYKPKSLSAPKQEVDWDSVPKGQRVEARLHGDWKLGVFKGFGDNYVLQIKFDDDESIREVPKHMARLSDAPLPKEKDPELTAVQQQIIEQEQVDVFQDSGDPQTDWTTAKVGEEVWAEIQGELQDCKFTKLLNDGQIVVTFEGNPHTVAADKVTRAALSGA